MASALDVLVLVLMLVFVLVLVLGLRLVLGLLFSLLLLLLLQLHLRLVILSERSESKDICFALPHPAVIPSESATTFFAQRKSRSRASVEGPRFWCWFWYWSCS